MLKEIITKWLGEEEKDEEEFSAKLMEKQVGYSYTKAYNQALTDLKSRIPELEEMIKKKVSIEWEDTKDEMYTYFGKCECGANSVIVGSKYCNECGSLIINTLKGVK